MNLRGLLIRQWMRRPGRALAAALSVAVAVGAAVATWAAADASRVGYKRLTEAVAGVPTIDVTARDGKRFDATAVPRLVDLPGVPGSLLAESGEGLPLQIALEEHALGIEVVAPPGRLPSLSIECGEIGFTLLDIAFQRRIGGVGLFEGLIE